MRTSIDEFGSSDHLQPPTYLIEVFADQKPDTNELLCYEIPIVGIEPHHSIFITRSLRPPLSTVSKPVKSKGKIYI